MPVTLSWHEITLRLCLTLLAGLAVGFNRGEHGRPAGMRTTLLVCLAASISMIQANLLMNSVGKAHDSFVVLDLMRLPLGILSGMGFIGAGAILRKDNLVLGVTTAATLWFTTVMGLCFGGGQIGLGIAALILGVATLWGLKHVEWHMRQDRSATLTLLINNAGPTDHEIRAAIARGDCRITAWGVAYHGDRRQVHGEIQRRILPTHTDPPAFVAELAQAKHIESVAWLPQGISLNRAEPKTDPQGTPIPISAAK